jgi:ribonuclease P protein component
MNAAERRLTRTQIAELFRTGHRTPFPGGAVLWHPGTTGRSRIAVSVAKRAAASAVARNRIRRRILAAAVPLLADISPTDMVIVWSNPAEPETEAVQKILQRTLATRRKE